MEIDDIKIRLIDDSDSITELTELLHRAYKPLADDGMRYFATHQTEDQTRKRIANGQCYVAILDGKIVGSVTFKYPVVFEGSDKSRWYSRPDVAYFGQFGVEPRLQGQGIGSRMLNLVERTARESGANELAFDTSENATRLIEYYSKRGFRFVEEIDHRPVVNYKSLIMSKRLVDVNAMLIRPFMEGDEAALWTVFFSAVHETSSADYAPEQLDAWAPRDIDPAKWAQRMQGIAPFVAECDGDIIGYADLQSDGYIDHFFVSPTVARQGVGSLLMKKIHEAAIAQGTDSLSAEVSVTARPFFEKWGFKVDADQTVSIGSETLKNFRMSKQDLTRT